MPILNTLSWIYGYFVKQRNNKFDNGRKQIFKSKIPVVSIGNLSVGGSGKTPFVRYVTSELLKMNYKPVIIGRGYKRKSKNISIISDGNRILCDVESAGDEMLFLAESLKVPIVVHSRKYIAASIVEKNFDADVILVDDGFQHRYLHREFDILLIDNETLKKPFLLPKGRLREPLDSIKRADSICLMNFPSYPEVLNGYINSQQIICFVNTMMDTPYLIGTGKLKDFNRDKAALCVAGIANPQRFLNSLEENNYNISKSILFRDHHNYSNKDIQNIIDTCKSINSYYIFTTEKDAVKLRNYVNDFVKNNIECLVFPLKVEITQNKEIFLKKLASIIEINKGTSYV